MMPGVAQPAPVSLPEPPMPPAHQITLWRAETGTEWLCLWRAGNFQTCVVRPAREQALADMIDFWRQFSAEGKAYRKAMKS